jgi:rubrerythrin
MEKTKLALKEVIIGESEAVIRYGKFSEVALNEHLPNIALLFKALAKAETVHIRNHLQALKEPFSPKIDDIGATSSTQKNLEDAIKGEIAENKEMYPRLIKSMKKESKELYGKVATLSMTWASKAEKVHADLLKMALKSIKNKKDVEFNLIFVCEVCGNVVIDGDARVECEICGHDTIFFKRESGN